MTLVRIYVRDMEEFCLVDIDIKRLDKINLNGSQWLTYGDEKIFINPRYITRVEVV